MDTWGLIQSIFLDETYFGSPRDFRIKRLSCWAFFVFVRLDFYQWPLTHAVLVIRWDRSYDVALNFEVLVIQVFIFEDIHINLFLAPITRTDIPYHHRRVLLWGLMPLTNLQCLVKLLDYVFPQWTNRPARVLLLQFPAGRMRPLRLLLQLLILHLLPLLVAVDLLPVILAVLFLFALVTLTTGRGGGELMVVRTIHRRLFEVLAVELSTDRHVVFWDFFEL